jgi:protein tyrosine phosphatase
MLIRCILYASQAKKLCINYVIYYSGGTGRTGTVILVDLCLRILREDNLVNIWAVLEKLRAQRVNMVETKVNNSCTYLSKYRFC